MLDYSRAVRTPNAMETTPVTMAVVWPRTAGCSFCTGAGVGLDGASASSWTSSAEVSVIMTLRNGGRGRLVKTFIVGEHT